MVVEVVGQVVNAPTLEDVVVAICVLNGEQDIAQCLESVRASQPAGIIVLDNGSIDSTVEIARRFTEDVYVVPRPAEIGHLRNVAATLAHARYILYVDADVTFPPETPHQLMIELMQNGYVGISHQILARYADTYWERAQDRHYRMTFNHVGRRGAITTCMALFRRDVLLETNFDSALMASEDGDLYYRLKKLGHSLGISQVACYHRHVSTFRAFARQRIWYGTSTWAFFRKHSNLGMLLMALAFGPVGAVWALLTGNVMLVPYLLAHGLFFSVGVVTAAFNGFRR